MSKNKPNETSKKTQKKRLFLTGFSMGLADLVPGVSGGTIALLFGIYDELLYTVRLVTGQIPKLVLKGKFKQAFELIPFGFLLPLITGIAVAIFGMVHVVTFLLETQKIFVWSFFFGLVVGSSYIISRRIKKWTNRHFLILILGMLITFFIVGLPSTSGSTAPLAIFTTGAIAITAMILPGISGSLIMVILGQYENIIKAVANRDYFTLLIFATGALVGLAMFVRLLTWLLKRYHFAVMAFLIGVMIGSLRRIWPWQTTNLDGSINNIMPSLEISLLIALALAIFGFSIVFLLEKFGITKEHNDIGKNKLIT